MSEPRPADDWLPTLYEELRRLAASRLAREADGHSLDATGLVHEAYLRLVGEQQFESRGHFFAAAAEAMRRILVDHARKRMAEKRGGGRQSVSLEESHLISQTPEGMIAVHEALEELAKESPQRAQLVEMRFFGGLTMADAALALNVSVATAERWWTFSRAWLFAALREKSEKE